MATSSLTRLSHSVSTTLSASSRSRYLLTGSLAAAVAISSGPRYMACESEVLCPAMRVAHSSMRAGDRELSTNCFASRH